MNARELHAHELFECHLRAVDGEVGRVRDLYLDDRRWTARYLVVDTGRWLRGRRVLVSPASVLVADGRRRYLRVNLTRSEVLGGPDVDVERPVSRQHEIAFHEYYGIPFYWSHDHVLESTKGGDPHLRSVRAITVYTVRSGDTVVGHVADVVLDGASWTATGLVIAAGRWPRAARLLAPARVIERVSWLGKTVYVEQGARIAREPLTA